MGLSCNIDSRGRRLRLVIGLVCFLVAAAVFYAAWCKDSLGLLITGVIFALGAGLCIWQARAGYCVVRGMGFKTPI
ncbi:MAG: hypothetical protein NTU53_16495 [Planctomycetota bacterium]|nr:hypothetical protein [Planctomycetota bacterium]